jgi:hypothetical protein
MGSLFDCTARPHAQLPADSATAVTMWSPLTDVLTFRAPPRLGVLSAFAGRIRPHDLWVVKPTRKGVAQRLTREYIGTRKNSCRRALFADSQGDDVMSDVSQGPGWWQASDGKWYPPESHPSGQVPPPPTSTAPSNPYGPGAWQTADGQWHPAQTMRQSPKRFYRRVWFWLLVSLVVVIVIVVAASAAINKANTTKHTVVYSVTGSGTADISYDSVQNGNSGSAQDTGATLPWTKTITGSGLFNVYGVNAQLTNGTSVTCNLTVDGKQIASHTSTGQYASVDCTGSAP